MSSPTVSSAPGAPPLRSPLSSPSPLSRPPHRPLPSISPPPLPSWSWAARRVTNTGPSVLNGALGVSPGTSLTGFGLPAVVNGATHNNNAVASQAQADLTAAYLVAAGQPVTSDMTGLDLGNRTLTPGAYRYSSSAQLTGPLTLDAQGNGERAVRLHDRLDADDRIGAARSC